MPLQRKNKTFEHSNRSGIRGKNEKFHFDFFSGQSTGRVNAGADTRERHEGHGPQI